MTQTGEEFSSLFLYHCYYFDMKSLKQKFSEDIYANFKIPNLKVEMINFGHLILSNTKAFQPLQLLRSSLLSPHIQKCQYFCFY